jgi:hypothetical protein
VVQGVVQSQLQGSSASLDFERLSASVLATLFVDTDVSLSGDYYLYNQDPAAFFVPNQVLAGRSPLVPIAPLQYLLRPEVLHRFGAFSARLWVQAGEYARGTGYGTVGMGTKLQYRFSKALRLWVTASGQRDVDYTHQATFSGTVSAGVGYRW